MTSYETPSRSLVTTKEYEKFRCDFFRGVFPPDLRYGQAFYNFFFAKGKIRGDLPWPQLFYETDINASDRLITTEVSKYDGEKGHTEDFSAMDELNYAGAKK